MWPSNNDSVLWFKCVCVCHSVHCTFECAQTLCSHCIKIMHRVVFFPSRSSQIKTHTGKMRSPVWLFADEIYIKWKNANKQQNSKKRFRSFLNCILVNNKEIMYYSSVQLIIQRLQSILIIRLGKSTRRSNKMVVTMNEA